MHRGILITFLAALLALIINSYFGISRMLVPKPA